ncbi:unnamed protein product, partial [marine sediment metagenome]
MVGLSVVSLRNPFPEAEPLVEIPLSEFYKRFSIESFVIFKGKGFRKFHELYTEPFFSEFRMHGQCTDGQ